MTLLEWITLAENFAPTIFSVKLMHDCTFFPLSVFLPSSDLSLSKSYEGEKLIRGWIIFWWHWSWSRLISLKFCTLSSKQSCWCKLTKMLWIYFWMWKSAKKLRRDLKRNTICPEFATQRPSSTVKSRAYQALTGATEDSFSEPSYVVVNQPEKQFPAIGGVLAETSLNSTGSSGAIASFGSPQAMNLLQDQLKAVRLNNGTSLTHTLIQ